MLYHLLEMFLIGATIALLLTAFAMVAYAIAGAIFLILEIFYNGFCTLKKFRGMK